MNDRIKELAEQAGILKEQSVQAKMIKNEDGTWASILKYPDLEKFAELIIREYSYDVMDLTAAPEHVAMAARHWGVEL